MSDGIIDEKDEKNKSAKIAERRQKLGKYLEPRGLDVDRFGAQVRDCFESSLEHHNRMRHCQLIANCLSLDISKEQDWDEFCKIVGDQQQISRKVRIQWQTGELDPPDSVIRRYLFHIDCPGIELHIAGSYDLAAPVRTAIARTLTYIDVFPPGDIKNPKLRNGQTSTELFKCWDMLAKHVHYRTPAGSPRRNLNQHALDQVHKMFGTRFWVNTSEIGDVKSSIEKDRNADHRLIWPWMFFKFATYVDIPATHSRKENPIKWIWDTKHSRFTQIWGR